MLIVVIIGVEGVLTPAEDENYLEQKLLGL